MMAQNSIILRISESKPYRSLTATAKFRECHELSIRVKLKNARASIFDAGRFSGPSKSKI